MADKPIYVTFYTPAYAFEVQKLAATLKVCDLEFHHVQLADLGSWSRNLHHQPTFIRDMMLEFEGRPVVWIDADSRVRRVPDLLNFGLAEQGYDFAAVWQENKPLTSVLYFQNNAKSWRMVRDWESADRVEGRSPAGSLASVMERLTNDDIMAAGLPESYRIQSSWCGIKQPTIEHIGMSRLLLPKL